MLRFVQLVCEGHYHPMQNYLRSQEGNRTNINLLMELVDSPRQPSALAPSPQPSALRPQPSPRPSALAPQPSALSP